MDRLMVMLTILSAAQLSSGARLHMAQLNRTSSRGGACVATEADGTLQYQVSFKILMERGCGRISCNVHKFMESKLKQVVRGMRSPADDNVLTCNCWAGKRKMFSFEADKCNTKSCWQMYANIMAISKRKEHKPFTPKDYLDSHSHWHVACDTQSIDTDAIAVPTLVDIVKEMKSKSQAKEEATIMKIVDFKEEDAEEVLEEVMDTEDEEIVDKVPQMEDTISVDSKSEGEFEDVMVPEDEVVEEEADITWDTPKVPEGCPYRMIWNIKGDERCHEVPSMKFVKTMCCRAAGLIDSI